MTGITINTLRRPSQARIRKSIRKATREVTWCPTEESTHEAISYDGVNHDQIWYSREELKEIRRDNEFTVNSYMEGKDTENEHETMRGLESWTDQGGWERFQHFRECMNRVLDEQDRQRGVDATECQRAAYPIVKRINHMHIPFDHNRLGALCRDSTAKARRVSLKRGRKDSVAAGTTEEVKQQVSLSVKELLKKFEKQQVNDTDTVQTEAMTFASADEDESRPPVPSVVSFQVTPESLLEKKNARFSKYLANRQQRIEAQMEKDFEWEQRRLARKAKINAKYDDHLEKMFNMIRATNELVSLVASSRTI